jgi:neutral ceramidase
MNVTVRSWANRAASTSAAVFLSLTAASAGVLQAGFARVEITPQQPVQLAGYGSRTDVSRTVHDPLWARAAAFEQDGQRFLLISIDNLGFYNNTAQPLRKAILDTCELKPAELMLAAVHTHSAPTLCLDPDRIHANNVVYTQKLQAQLANLGRAAMDRMKPVRLAFGSGSSPVGANRRETVTGDDGKASIVLGRNPAAMTDREVQVIKFVHGQEEGLAAVLFGYATHSTSLGPRNYSISGDIHGLAAQFVEKYFQTGMFASAFAGASGDIDPWYRILPDFKTNNGWIPETVLLGTMLGEEVVHVLENIHDYVSIAPIKCLARTVDLPGKEASAPAGEKAVGLPFALSVARMGDIAFLGFGGEVFNQIGARIKSASPFPHTFIFTHCNGAAGYVPTAGSYAEGGYEVQTSRYAPEAEETLVREALKLLNELHANNS